MARRPKIIDLRGQLATHPTRRFRRRRLEDVHGVVFHQALGDGTVRGIARYHVSEESHISPGRGCPGICYTFFVDTDGAIYQCNDLEAVTWSQGGPTPPPLPMTRPNTNYLAVCFRGDFRGKGHHGGNPTDAQLAAGRALWAWLRDDLGLSEDSLFGHHDFGKPACPGTALSKLIAEVCAEGLDVKGNRPRGIKAWQAGLKRLGYDLGAWGPKKDGVDGQWGKDSQTALLAFQKVEGLSPGAMDAATSTRLAERLAALPKPEPKPRASRRRKTTAT
jgi:hypothetical protein